MNLDLQIWNNFFSAEVGAAATLTGLLFVAVSINLARILQLPHLPGRAAEALLALVSVLFVGSFALIPGQSATCLGFEVAITGIVVWSLETAALIRTRKHVHQAFVLRVLLNQLPPVPFVISGSLLVAGRPSALFWMVPGVLLSFIAGIFDAWVLLIEILR
jgi:hypothetical protein